MEKTKKEERILRFLIYLGLITILVSLYIQYIEPFFIKLAQQKRDKTRIENLSLINSALEKILKNNLDLSIGNPNIVYISVPSDNPNCNNLKLSSLPKKYRYACKSKDIFQNIDGSGWLPVNFTKLTENIFTDHLFPVDPINIAEDGYYYTYIADKGFELSALLESDKYSLLSSKNNGIYSNKFEIGTNPDILKNLELTKGLKAYYNFNEKEGEILNDYSDYNNNGYLISSIKNNNWVDGITGSALNFDGINNNYVKIKDNLSIQDIFNEGGSVSVWIKPNSAGGDGVGRIIQKDDDINKGWILYLSDEFDKSIRLGFIQRFSGGNEAWITDRIININSWTHIIIIYKNAPNRDPMIYINGKKVDVKKTTTISGNSTSDKGINLYIGNNTTNNNAFDGSIDEIRIYDIFLNDEKINFLYKDKSNYNQ